MEKAGQEKWESELSTALRTVDESIQNLRKQFSSYKDQGSSSPAIPSVSSGNHSYTQLQTPLQPKYESTPTIQHRSLSKSSFFTHPNTLFADETSSQSIIGSLMRRVEEQSETIASLSGAVATLQQENLSQSKVINTLKEDVNKLPGKRKSGSMPDFDDVAAKIRKELKTEISTLKEKIQKTERKIDPKGLDTRTLSKVSKSLIDNKKLCQEQFDSLKQEIDNVRTRLVKYDLDLAATLGGVNGLSRKNEDHEKEIFHLQNRQREILTKIDQLEARYTKPQTNGLSDYPHGTKTKMEKKTRNYYKDNSENSNIQKRGNRRKKLRKSLTTESDLSPSFSELEDSLEDDSFADLNTEELIRGKYDRDILHSSSPDSIESDFLKSL